MLEQLPNLILIETLKNMLNDSSISARDNCAVDATGIPFDQLEVRTMFGGLGIFCDSCYLGAAIKGKLYLRVNPTTFITLPELTKKATECNTPNPEPQLNPTLCPLVTSEGYRFAKTVEVPKNILTDTKLIKSWVYSLFA